MLVPAQPVQLTVADLVVFDQCILGNLFLFHGLPQFVIYDHGFHPPSDTMLLYSPKNGYDL